MRRRKRRDVRSTQFVLYFMEKKKKKNRYFASGIERLEKMTKEMKSKYNSFSRRIVFSCEKPEKTPTTIGNSRYSDPTAYAYRRVDDPEICWLYFKIEWM